MVNTTDALRYTCASRRRIASSSADRSQAASDTPYPEPSRDIAMFESQNSAYGSPRRPAGSNLAPIWRMQWRRPAWAAMARAARCERSR